MSNKNRHYFAFSLKNFNRIHDGYFLSEITDKKPFLSIVFFVALRSRVCTHRRTRTYNKYSLFCASVFLNGTPRVFFASLIHKFHDPIFFKTLDSDMQYKYNAISVETTIRR